MAKPLYHTSDGVVYRVLDCTLRDFKRTCANPPAAWATTRIFRPAEGYRRLYVFIKGEDREPSPEALARQLRSAEYMPTMPTGGFKGDPR